MIPVGLWGTEKVWPRSSPAAQRAERRRPADGRASASARRSTLKARSLDADTKRIMKAIVDLLPAGEPRGALTDISPGLGR